MLTYEITLRKKKKTKQREQQGLTPCTAKYPLPPPLPSATVSKSVIVSIYAHFVGPGIACWLERWTCDRKVVSLNLGRSGRRIFFSRVNFVCRLLSGVRFILMLLQWHVKDPSHSAKSAGGRLNLNTYTPLTQRSQSGLTMLLSRHNTA